MLNLRLKSYVLMLALVLAGCTSVPPAQPVAVVCPAPPPPAAWSLKPPPNLSQTLNRLISSSPAK